MCFASRLTDLLAKVPAGQRLALRFLHFISFVLVLFMQYKIIVVWFLARSCRNFAFAAAFLQVQHLWLQYIYIYMPFLVGVRWPIAVYNLT